MELILARAEDIDAVVKIYDSVRGVGFCVWNENYPTREHAERDRDAVRERDFRALVRSFDYLQKIIHSFAPYSTLFGALPSITSTARAAGC